MPQDRRFKLSNGKPVKFPNDWSDDQVADVLTQMEAELHAPPPAPKVEDAIGGLRAFAPIVQAGMTGNAATLPPFSQKMAGRLSPMVASGMAAALTGGMSIPAQALAHGVAGALGSGAQTGLEGGDASEVAENMARGGVIGAGSGAAGAMLGRAGQALKAKATPTRIVSGGFEKAEEVPTGILDPAGKMTTRTVLSKTPEWTKEIPPDFSTMEKIGDTAADFIGMKVPWAGFAARNLTRAMSQPAVLRGLGSAMQTAAPPGIPFSMSALLSLLNAKNPQ